MSCSRGDTTKVALLAAALEVLKASDRAVGATGMRLQDIDAAFEIPIDLVERANHRKLTDDDVRAIRYSKRSINALARRFPRRAQGRAVGAPWGHTWTRQMIRVSGAHGPESGRLMAAVRRPLTGSIPSGAAGAVTCSGGAARDTDRAILS